MRVWSLSLRKIDILSVLALLSLSPGLQSCNSSSGSTPAAPDPTAPSVVPKGNRMLGMDVNDAAQDTTFSQGFTEAQNMGVTGIGLLIDWKSIEPGPGNGTTAGAYVDPGNTLATANAFYPGNGAMVSLNIAPIDMGAYVVPSDLAGKTLDDLILINRYLQALDFVFSKLPTVTFVNIQLGNEIDSAAQAGTVGFWTSYYTFLGYAVQHIHASHPGIKVGVTATFNGLVGNSAGGGIAKAGLQQLAGALDEMGVTYYPLNADFTVEPVSVVASDFDQLTNLYSKPLYIEEAGYPTSSGCNSSVTLQASFVSAIFSAWDSHATQIPYVSFLRLNDWSLATAQSFAGAGATNAFIEYLRTLGLRTYTTPSADKQAVSTLRSATSARGWTVH